MKELLAVFLGGGTGCVLRYMVQLCLHERITPYDSPWATFVVNIFGSFMIGAFYAISERFSLSPEVRLLLTAGLCGGFTTFSTFSHDNVEMLRHGDFVLCAVYILISVLLGIVACFGGAWLCHTK